MRLLQMSVMGSVLIVLTMLLRRLVGDKLPPGCYLVLWSLAGVRLLLPVMIASPFSVYQLLQKTDSNGVTVFYEPMIPDRLQEMHTVVQPIMKELLFPNIIFLLRLKYSIIDTIDIIVAKYNINKSTLILISSNGKL